jgi:ABC-type multidrug transport system fused ATPase/permease subunit
VRRAYVRLFGFLEERLAGTEDIRANGAEAYVVRRFVPLQRDVVQGEVKGHVLDSFASSATYFLYTASLVVTLGLGATFFTRGEMSIGTVYLLVAYVGLLEAPIAEIQRQVADLRQVFASVSRINSLFQIEPQVQVGAGRLPPGPYQVTFQDVDFRYRDALSAGDAVEPDANGSSVLHQVSFQLAPGRTLGLLGRTGSGKTTLARLLFRLYDVDSGAIRLNGRDIRQVGLSDLRRSVGMVTQEVQLFAASVRDNLTFFRREIDDAKILAALEELGLDAWLRSLPAGLDTELEGGGKGLSAGEAQLLAFTRVLLRDPGLVILDEASSRLDPATERRLERAMGRLLAGRTGIIIAHRLQTVQRADEILILESGRVIEYGPRADLAADPDSRFYHLLQTGLAEVLA